jgi:hypothetical protein
VTINASEHGPDGTLPMFGMSVLRQQPPFARLLSGLMDLNFLMRASMRPAVTRFNEAAVWPG